MDETNNTPVPEIIPLPEALIDPKWRTNLVAVGGAQFVLLRLDHPREGTINCVMTLTSAASLRDWLIKFVV